MADERGQPAAPLKKPDALENEKTAIIPPNVPIDRGPIALARALEEKTKECAVIARVNTELKSALNALRSDISAQKSEQTREMKAMQELLQLAHDEARSLRSELAETRQTTKQLKQQTLSLQYHANLWGLPVASGDGAAGVEDGGEDLQGGFFPVLTPPPGSAEPGAPVLKGELASFCFPNVLQFLANSNLQGVLTVITDGIVSKLYFESAWLKLASWNNRDPDLSLSALLAEAQLVPLEVLARLTDQPIFDLELASLLIQEAQVPAPTIQAGLREHARVILGFLFHTGRGSFYFQPGKIPRKRELQFRLSIQDVLLKTAAAMDEKTRVGLVRPEQTLSR